MKGVDEILLDWMVAQNRAGVHRAETKAEATMDPLSSLTKDDKYPYLPPKEDNKYPYLTPKEDIHAISPSAWTEDQLKAILEEISNHVHMEVPCLDLALKQVFKVGLASIIWRRDYTIMHLAAEHGRLDMISLLVDLGGDMEKTDWKGRTPIDVAEAHGNSHCADLCRRLAFLEKTKSVGSVSALHSAVHKTFGLLDLHWECVQAAERLFRTRTDNFRGGGALHVAASVGEHRAVPLLVRLNANLTLKDSNGKTPLDIAKDAKDMETVFCLGKALEDSLIERSIPARSLALERPTTKPSAAKPPAMANPPVRNRNQRFSAVEGEVIRAAPVDGGISQTSVIYV